ncbi:flagellar basal-body MS-ring/collar protein FliF [Sporosarcina sp. HYO08]|uniref:flagellar basal-body MS-ring/collar protein FliF n=1 Tax=Sporosarcina sp. HYO08 TaxID=1759557 RepID=UPI00079A5046|nr:flagellar basal-body MS-ring/collar protein FliF [Sporosarcina sp. HYO08]KXH79978.1 flagellar M-ring protein FliF [Sporosarcina sp. HYO08]
MNERLTKLKSDSQAFWVSRTRKQKITYIGSTAVIILFAALLTYFLSRTEFVPLYTDVSQAEIGRIKEQLDSQGVPNQIAPGGTSILVPREQVDDLLVSLASEGFPHSGLIDYSFFSENAGFGTTDNEFQMLKLATMQTELANLIKGIDGVKDAKVMITLPTGGVFITDQKEQASAAIMLKTNPGHQFTEAQINALYHLVSKSLPNLSTDDIIIMNQYSEYYDLKATTSGNGPSIADQMTVKKTIERDLQRQVQMMLGTMMGQDKVVVSVTTDIDFKLENREESLVQPVDEESMEGIALSVQRLTETFTGNGAVAGGIPEAEDVTDNHSSYVDGTFSNGDYERIEETVNNEVNRIRKEIVESPYKIRDIGIQVMVDSPAENTNLSAQDVQRNVERILATIIRTSIDKEAAGELSDTELESKIVVVVQPFSGNSFDFDAAAPKVPWWIYAVGAALLLLIGTLVFLLLKKKRQPEEVEEPVVSTVTPVAEIDDIHTENETEGSLRKKQLEKLAKEKPEEFAKLLRSWISDD